MSKSLKKFFTFFICIIFIPNLFGATFQHPVTKGTETAYPYIASDYGPRNYSPSMFHGGVDFRITRYSNLNSAISKKAYSAFDDGTLESIVIPGEIAKKVNTHIEISSGDKTQRWSYFHMWYSNTQSQNGVNFRIGSATAVINVDDPDQGAVDVPVNIGNCIIVYNEEISNNYIAYATKKNFVYKETRYDINYPIQGTIQIDTGNVTDIRITDKLNYNSVIFVPNADPAGNHLDFRRADKKMNPFKYLRYTGYNTKYDVDAIGNSLQFGNGTAAVGFTERADKKLAICGDEVYLFTHIREKFYPGVDDNYRICKECDLERLTIYLNEKQIKDYDYNYSVKTSFDQTVLPKPMPPEGSIITFTTASKNYGLAFDSLAVGVHPLSGLSDNLPGDTCFKAKFNSREKSSNVNATFDSEAVHRDGEYEYAVKATDIRGNAEQITRTVIIDNFAPYASYVILASDSNFYDNIYIGGWKSELDSSGKATMFPPDVNRKFFRNAYLRIKFSEKMDTSANKYPSVVLKWNENTVDKTYDLTQYNKVKKWLDPYTLVLGNDSILPENYTGELKIAISGGADTAGNQIDINPATVAIKNYTGFPTSTYETSGADETHKFMAGEEVVPPPPTGIPAGFEKFVGCDGSTTVVKVKNADGLIDEVPLKDYIKGVIKAETLLAFPVSQYSNAYEALGTAITSLLLYEAPRNKSAGYDILVNSICSPVPYKILYDAWGSSDGTLLDGIIDKVCKQSGQDLYVKRFRIDGKPVLTLFFPTTEGFVKKAVQSAQDQFGKYLFGLNGAAVDNNRPSVSVSLQGLPPVGLEIASAMSKSASYTADQILGQFFGRAPLYARMIRIRDAKESVAYKKIMNGITENSPLKRIVETSGAGLSFTDYADIEIGFNEKVSTADIFFESVQNTLTTYGTIEEMTVSLKIASDRYKISSGIIDNVEYPAVITFRITHDEIVELFGNTLAGSTSERTVTIKISATDVNGRRIDANPETPEFNFEDQQYNADSSTEHSDETCKFSIMKETSATTMSGSGLGIDSVMQAGKSVLESLAEAGVTFGLEPVTPITLFDGGIELNLNLPRMDIDGAKWGYTITNSMVLMTRALVSETSSFLGGMLQMALNGEDGSGVRGIKGPDIYSPSMDTSAGLDNWASQLFEDSSFCKPLDGLQKSIFQMLDEQIKEKQAENGTTDSIVAVSAPGESGTLMVDSLGKVSQDTANPANKYSQELSVFNNISSLAIIGANFGGDFDSQSIAVLIQMQDIANKISIGMAILGAVQMSTDPLFADHLIKGAIGYGKSWAEGRLKAFACQLFDDVAGELIDNNDAYFDKLIEDAIKDLPGGIESLGYSPKLWVGDGLKEMKETIKNQMKAETFFKNTFECDYGGTAPEWDIKNLKEEDYWAIAGQVADYINNFKGSSDLLKGSQFMNSFSSNSLQTVKNNLAAMNMDNLKLIGKGGDPGEQLTVANNAISTIGGILEKLGLLGGVADVVTGGISTIGPILIAAFNTEEGNLLTTMKDSMGQTNAFTKALADNKIINLNAMSASMFPKIDLGDVLGPFGGLKLDSFPFINMGINKLMESMNPEDDPATVLHNLTKPGSIGIYYPVKITQTAADPLPPNYEGWIRGFTTDRAMIHVRGWARDEMPQFVKVYAQADNGPVVTTPLNLDNSLVTMGDGKSAQADWYLDIPLPHGGPNNVKIWTYNAGNHRVETNFTAYLVGTTFPQNLSRAVPAASYVIKQYDGMWFSRTLKDMKGGTVSFLNAERGTAPMSELFTCVGSDIEVTNPDGTPNEDLEIIDAVTMQKAQSFVSGGMYRLKLKSKYTGKSFVNVIGAADAKGFKEYKLQYAPGHVDRNIFAGVDCDNLPDEKPDRFTAPQWAGIQSGCAECIARNSAGNAFFESEGGIIETDSRVGANKLFGFMAAWDVWSKRLTGPFTMRTKLTDENLNWQDKEFDRVQFTVGTPIDDDVIAPVIVTDPYAKMELFVPPGLVKQTEYVSIYTENTDPVEPLPGSLYSAFTNKFGVYPALDESRLNAGTPMRITVKYTEEDLNIPNLQTIFETGDNADKIEKAKTIIAENLGVYREIPVYDSASDVTNTVRELLATEHYGRLEYKVTADNISEVKGKYFLMAADTPPVFRHQPVAAPFMFNPEEPAKGRLTTRIRFFPMTTTSRFIYARVDIMDSDKTRVVKNLYDGIGTKQPVELKYCGDLTEPEPWGVTDTISRKHYFYNFSDESPEKVLPAPLDGIEWDGTGKKAGGEPGIVEDGVYRAVITVMDSFGNTVSGECLIVKGRNAPEIQQIAGRAAVNSLISLDAASDGAVVTVRGTASAGDLSSYDGYMIGCRPSDYSGPDEEGYEFMKVPFPKTATDNYNRTQITTGKLADWNISGLADGAYDVTLFIKAADNEGNTRTIDSVTVKEITIGNTRGIYNAGASPNPFRDVTVLSASVINPGHDSVTFTVTGPEGLAAELKGVSVQGLTRYEAPLNGSALSNNTVYSVQVSAEGLAPVVFNLRKLDAGEHLIAYLTPVANVMQDFYVLGTAGISDSSEAVPAVFDNYELLMSQDGGEYVLIGGSGVPENGVLGKVEFKDITGDTIGLKLIVTDKTGNTAVAELTAIPVGFAAQLRIEPFSVVRDTVSGTATPVNFRYDITKEAESVQINITGPEGYTALLNSSIAPLHKGSNEFSWNGEGAPLGRYSAEMLFTKGGGQTSTGQVEFSIVELSAGGAGSGLDADIDGTPRPYFDYTVAGRGYYDVPFPVNMTLTAHSTMQYLQYNTVVHESKSEVSGLPDNDIDPEEGEFSEFTISFNQTISYNYSAGGCGDKDHDAYLRVYRNGSLIINRDFGGLTTVTGNITVLRGDVVTWHTRALKDYLCFSPSTTTLRIYYKSMANTVQTGPATGTQQGMVSMIYAHKESNSAPFSITISPVPQGQPIDWPYEPRHYTIANPYYESSAPLFANDENGIKPTAGYEGYPPEMFGTVITGWGVNSLTTGLYHIPEDFDCVTYNGVNILGDCDGSPTTNAGYFKGEQYTDIDIPFAVTYTANYTEARPLTMAASWTVSASDTSLITYNYNPAVFGWQASQALNVLLKCKKTDGTYIPVSDVFNVTCYKTLMGLEFSTNLTETSSYDNTTEGYALRLVNNTISFTDVNKMTFQRINNAEECTIEIVPTDLMNVSYNRTKTQVQTYQVNLRDGEENQPIIINVKDDCLGLVTSSSITAVFDQNYFVYDILLSDTTNNYDQTNKKILGTINYKIRDVRSDDWPTQMTGLQNGTVTTVLGNKIPVTFTVKAYEEMNETLLAERIVEKTDMNCASVQTYDFTIKPNFDAAFAFECIEKRFNTHEDVNSHLYITITGGEYETYLDYNTTIRYFVFKGGTEYKVTYSKACVDRPNIDIFFYYSNTETLKCTTTRTNRYYYKEAYGGLGSQTVIISGADLLETTPGSGTVRMSFGLDLSAGSTGYAQLQRYSSGSWLPIYTHETSNYASNLIIPKYSQYRLITTNYGDSSSASRAFIGIQKKDYTGGYAGSLGKNMVTYTAPTNTWIDMNEAYQVTCADGSQVTEFGTANTVGRKGVIFEEGKTYVITKAANDDIQFLEPASVDYISNFNLASSFNAPSGAEGVTATSSDISFDLTAMLRTGNISAISVTATSALADPVSGAYSAQYSYAVGVTPGVLGCTASFDLSPLQKSWQMEEKRSINNTVLFGKERIDNIFRDLAGDHTDSTAWYPDDTAFAQPFPSLAEYMKVTSVTRLMPYPIGPYNVPHSSDWGETTKNVYCPMSLEPNRDVVVTTDYRVPGHPITPDGFQTGANYDQYDIDKVSMRLRDPSVEPYDSKTYIKIKGNITLDDADFGYYTVEFKKSEEDSSYYRLVTVCAEIPANGILGYMYVKDKLGSYDIRLNEVAKNGTSKTGVTRAYVGHYIDGGSNTITALGGMATDAYEQLQLYFPPGALRNDKVVSMTPVKRSDVPLLAAESGPVGLIYSFAAADPESSVPGKLRQDDFNTDALGNITNPAVLRLAYDEAQLGENFPEEAITLYKIDIGKSGREELRILTTVVDLVNNVISTEIDSFSTINVMPNTDPPSFELFTAPGSAGYCTSVTIYAKSSKTLSEGENGVMLNGTVSLPQGLGSVPLNFIRQEKEFMRGIGRVETLYTSNTPDYFGNSGRMLVLGDSGDTTLPNMGKAMPAMLTGTAFTLGDGNETKDYIIKTAGVFSDIDPDTGNAVNGKFFVTLQDAEDWGPYYLTESAEAVIADELADFNGSITWVWRAKDNSVISKELTTGPQVQGRQLVLIETAPGEELQFPYAAWFNGKTIKISGDSSKYVLTGVNITGSAVTGVKVLGTLESENGSVLNAVNAAMDGKEWVVYAPVNEFSAILDMASCIPAGLQVSGTAEVSINGVDLLGNTGEGRAQFGIDTAADSVYLEVNKNTAKSGDTLIIRVKTGSAGNTPQASLEDSIGNEIIPDSVSEIIVPSTGIKTGETIINYTVKETDMDSDPDGHDIVVRAAADVCGITDEKTIYIDVDNTPPWFTFAVVSGLHHDGVAGIGQVILRLRTENLPAEPLVTVSYTDEKTGNTLKFKPILTGPSAVGDGTYEYNVIFNIDATFRASSMISVEATGYDFAGNKGSGSFNFTADTKAPGAIKGLEAFVSDGYAGARWDIAPVSDGVAYYILHVEQMSGSGPGAVTHTTISTANISFLMTSLAEYGQKYKFTVAAVDVHGNIGPASDAFVIIDTSAPETAVEAVGNSYAANYISPDPLYIGKETLLQITAVDDAAGVGGVYYGFISSPVSDMSPYSALFACETANTPTAIYHYATDYNGNSGTVGRTYVYKDTKIPDISVTVYPSYTGAGGEIKLPPPQEDITTWDRERIISDIASSSGLSDAAKEQLNMLEDEELLELLYSIMGGLTVPSGEGAQNQITYINSENAVFMITANDYYSMATVTAAGDVIAENIGSGIKIIDYRIDDGNVIRYYTLNGRPSAPLPFRVTGLAEGLHTIEAVAEDNVGNKYEFTGMGSNIRWFAVDATPPDVYAYLNTGGSSVTLSAKGEPVTVDCAGSMLSFSAEDKGVMPSGVSQILYSINGREPYPYGWPLPVPSGTVVISYFAVDKVGNTGEVKTVTLYCNPTSTPTFTATATETPTLTVTRTATETITPTVTQTVTDTVTPTVTATITATATETITPSITATVTGTATETITGTATETVTETITGTVTPTVTETITSSTTPTVTGTATGTITETITETATATVTETITSSTTPTVTGTATGTITETVTATGTITITVTETITKTVTGTSTPSATLTNTETITPTFTLTHTPTATMAVVLKAKTDDLRDMSNSPHPQLMLINGDSRTLELSLVEIRYWYMSDGTDKVETAIMDYAGIQPSGVNVTAGSVMQIVSGSYGAGQDRYMKISFNSSSLTSNETLLLNTRFNKSDWSEYIQTNDYSFPSSSEYIVWNKVTVYYGGNLIWGIEPDLNAPEPTNTPVVTMSSTLTASPTLTLTITKSGTPTSTGTGTATASATVTVTPTNTRTRTVTPSSTETITKTLTPVMTTATPTITPTVSNINLALQYRASDTNSSTNSPHSQFRLYNNSENAIQLNRITIKYWYVFEGTNQSESAAIDYAGIMPSGTNIASAASASITQGAFSGQNRYLKVSFGTGAGSLAFNDYVEIHTRFNKNDWSNYTQTNDWSYGVHSAFMNWYQVTVYVDGIKVWGFEPGEVQSSGLDTLMSRAQPLSTKNVYSYPNPFKNYTNIRFSLDEKFDTHIRIYDLNGYCVWSVLLGKTDVYKGINVITWDGLQNDGRPAVNGVYVLEIKAGGTTVKKKIACVR